MNRPVFVHSRNCQEAARLGLGTERVDICSVEPPRGLARTEQAIGPLEQLEKLTWCVDVAEPCRVNSILTRLVASFGDQKAIAISSQSAADVLSKTAPCRGDLVAPCNFEARGCSRAHIFATLVADCSGPESVVRGMTVWVIDILVPLVTLRQKPKQLTRRRCVSSMNVDSSLRPKDYAASCGVGWMGGRFPG